MTENKRKKKRGSDKERKKNIKRGKEKKEKKQKEIKMGKTKDYIRVFLLLLLD